MAYKPILFTKSQIKTNLREVAKYKSKLKAINTRISAIAKTFGTDSNIYRSTVESIINTDKNANYYHVNKKGIVQINVTNKLLTTEEGTHIYNISKRTRTLSDIKKSYAPERKESVKNLRVEIENRFNYEKEIAAEISNMMSRLEHTHTDEEMREIKDILYTDKKPTYEDIEEFLERFENEV